MVNRQASATTKTAETLTSTDVAAAIDRLDNEDPNIVKHATRERHTDA